MKPRYPPAFSRGTNLYKRHSGMDHFRGKKTAANQKAFLQTEKEAADNHSDATAATSSRNNATRGGM